MKTRQQFFECFFTKLRERRFTVKQLYEDDIAAEIYAGPGLFCVITRDGDIVYEDYNSDHALQIEHATAETRELLGFCVSAPFMPVKQQEIVNLSQGMYYTMFESAGAAMLYRFSELFGYEFMICQKLPRNHERRKFYREKLFYDRLEAYGSFLERSGFEINRNAPSFNEKEWMLILECCTQRVMLDTELSSETETQINSIIQKIEAALPERIELTPRQFFIDEIGDGV